MWQEAFPCLRKQMISRYILAVLVGSQPSQDELAGFPKQLSVVFP